MAVMIALIVVGFVVVVVLLYFISIYNALVSLAHSIDKAWSNIDVLLKQRFDELPKLVEVVKGYKLHEQQVLENITRARSLLQNGGTGAQRHEAENQLTMALRSLFAVAESYPELKADASFRELQTRISELENMIADRREMFNEYVNTYNIRLEQFPDVIVARMMNFRSRHLWQIDSAQRQDVKIAF